MTWPSPQDSIHTARQRMAHNMAALEEQLAKVRHAADALASREPEGSAAAAEHLATAAHAAEKAAEYKRHVDKLHRKLDTLGLTPEVRSGCARRCDAGAGAPRTHQAVDIRLASAGAADAPAPPAAVVANAQVRHSHLIAQAGALAEVQEQLRGAQAQVAAYHNLPTSALGASLVLKRAHQRLGQLQETLDAQLAHLA